MSDDQTTLEEVVARLQGLLGEVERYSDPIIKRTVFELLDWLDTLHREGLERLAAGLRSVDFFDKAADDPVVAHLFAVYGLLDGDDPAPLIEEALEEVRPYLHSHGGEMQFDSVEAGVVRVSLFGACQGCPSAVVTLTQSLEQAVRERWPGLVRIEVAEERAARRPLPLPIQPLQ